MVNHQVRHLQQRFVTTDISSYFEVATRVHLRESILKEAPLEQTFPAKTTSKLFCRIIYPISPPASTYIFYTGTFGVSLALFVPTPPDSPCFLSRKIPRSPSGIPLCHEMGNVSVTVGSYNLLWRGDGRANRLRISRHKHSPLPAQPDRR